MDGPHRSQRHGVLGESERWGEPHSMVVSHLRGCVGVCVNVRKKGGRCEVLE